MGDDVDVLKFPSPIWHEKDGGRYIGTGTFSITRDPEENWLNAGAYRAQVHGRTSVGIADGRRPPWRASISRNISGAASRCRSPWCSAAIRSHSSMAASKSPYGVFEIDVVGGLRGRPMQMVRGKVTGCRFRPAPRSCSKAMSRPTSAQIEGPFGEWTGHYAGGAKPCTVLDVKAIYHRNDPILSACRRWAAGRTRWRATARSCARPPSSRT